MEVSAGRWAAMVQKSVLVNMAVVVLTGGPQAVLVKKGRDGRNDCDDQKRR